MECLEICDQARPESLTQFISFNPTPGPYFVEGDGGFQGQGKGGVHAQLPVSTPWTTRYCLPEGGMVSLNALLPGSAGAWHTVGTPQDRFLILHPGTGWVKVSRGSHTTFSPQGPHWQCCPVGIVSLSSDSLYPVSSSKCVPNATSSREPSWISLYPSTQAQEPACTSTTVLPLCYLILQRVHTVGVQ